MQTYRTRIFPALFALLCWFAVTGATLLQDPAAIPLPAAAHKDQVRELILAAMDYRGWQPGKVENNALVATLAIRKHVIKIVIDFSGDAVTFRYKESINMKYLERSGLEYIHGNYNQWTGVLADEIATRLKALSGT